MTHGHLNCRYPCCRSLSRRAVGAELRSVPMVPDVPQVLVPLVPKVRKVLARRNELNAWNQNLRNRWNPWNLGKLLFQDAELNHEAQHVHLNPVLDEPAILSSPDVDV